MSQADQAAQDQSSSKMITKSVKEEEWREYSWICPVTGIRNAYRILNPVNVSFYRGCTTHRVTDNDGVVHCVPAVGFYNCVLTWKSHPGAPAVSW